jgi:hypothetical protein
LYARRDREEAGGGFGGPAPISKPTQKERTLDSVGWILLTGSLGKHFATIHDGLTADPINGLVG